MNNWINILTESYWETLDVECDYGGRHIVEVFKNPSRLEFNRLMRKSEHGSLRASLYADGTLLVWEGTSVQHHDLDAAITKQVADFVPQHYIRLFLDATGVSMHESPDDDAQKMEEEAITSKPTLKRIFGSDFEISFP